MGWFFKGLPSGKRVVPIYPMETPNGAANTVGGRFIPSGLLLAQDFTHKPACQTGECAPQGRFRHQPEQMVHPPFAGQLASFPSLPVCEEEAPYCPLRDFATQISSSEIGARQNRLGERQGDAIKHPKLIGHSIFGKVLKIVGRR